MYKRTLSPDLARGFMLLLIAVANVWVFQWGQEPSSLGFMIKPVSVIDKVVVFLRTVLVDQRALPLFAFLFGYGMVQFSRSRYARGFEGIVIRRMLRRRHWGMLLFGFLHAALLFEGDILGSYAIIALFWGWIFFRRTNKTLTIVFWVFIACGILTLLANISAGLAILSEKVPAEYLATDTTVRLVSTGTPGYLDSILQRLQFWVTSAPVAAFMAFNVMSMVILGWKLARQRFLEEPKLERLKKGAWLGLGIGWIGGIPSALNQIGVLNLNIGFDASLHFFSMMTGVAGGYGYVCLIGLIASRIESSGKTMGWFITGVVGLGKRSLSGYLGQSVLFAVLLPAWTFGLGSKLGVATASLYAIAVWVVTVVIAYFIEKSGRRGPFEVLLRRLTYGSKVPVAGCGPVEPGVEVSGVKQVVPQHMDPDPTIEAPEYVAGDNPFATPKIV